MDPIEPIVLMADPSGQPMRTEARYAGLNNGKHHWVISAADGPAALVIITALPPLTTVTAVTLPL